MFTQKHDIGSACQHNGMLLMGRPMKALVLAGALAIFAASAAQATEGAPAGANDHNGRTAALLTDGGQGAVWMPVVTSPANGTQLATEGPGSPTDGTSRSGVSVAGDGGPGSPTDNTGRSGVSVARDGGPANAGDHDGRTAELRTDSGQGAVWMPVVTSPANGTRLATDGPGNPTDNTGRSVS